MTPQPDGENPWTSRLGLLVLTHVVGTANIVSVLAMAPVITRELGIGAAEFGFFVTAYYGAQAVCSLPAGGLVDRLGVGRALIVCHVRGKDHHRSRARPAASPSANRSSDES